MTVFQEDPFQQIVNVGWGTSWAVLAWQSSWKATLDDPNNPVVSIGSFSFSLYDNPANVVDGDVLYVTGKAPFKDLSTSVFVGTKFTTVAFSMTVHSQNGLDTGIGFGFRANHVTGTDGTDHWVSPINGLVRSSLDALVLDEGWNDGYSDVAEIGTHTSGNPDVTLYTVQHNALIFIKVPPFRKLAPTLSIDFDIGLVPFPDVFETYYKTQARLATFSSATVSSFTATNDIPDDWFVKKSVALATVGDTTTNQPPSMGMHFDIDLTTLAASGSLRTVG